MQLKEDQRRGRSGRPSMSSRLAQVAAALECVGSELAALTGRFAGLEADIAALKSGLPIVESRLTGLEARERHAASGRERMERRFSDFDFGVDRVQCELTTLKDRVRCVELDLRELSGALLRGAVPPDGERATVSTVSAAVRGAAALKSR